MAGLDGYSSAWSGGLYVGGSRDRVVKQDTDNVPLSLDRQVAQQQRERKRQIRENPEVRKQLEYEIGYLKRNIKYMERMLQDLEAEHRKLMIQSRCSAYKHCELTFDCSEYSKRHSQIELEIRHSECVLRSKEKLLHDALNK